MHKFKAIKISDNVYWVGAIDWGIRDMHGYATHRGTTYNAYLILGESPILIDTVKHEFFHEMMSRIKSVLDPSKIKYIISNHAEMDHSGSLKDTIDAVCPEKIFASKAGKLALNNHFHDLDFDISVIEDSKEMDIDGNKFTFFETKMLHWPDSMVSYFHNDKILFTQDGFGMHLATTRLMASENHEDILREEAAKYFANILFPYINIAKNFINKLPGLDIDIKLLAPDHGPIWDSAELIEWIVSLYTEWSQQKPTAKAIILYDSMWHSTETLANVMADELMQKGINVVVIPATGSHRSDLATEILECGALLIGTPTLNNNMFPAVADMLYYIKGLKPKNLIGQAFGSFGWSGEGVRQVKEIMDSMGIEMIDEPINCKYVPDDKVIENVRSLASNIAELLLKRNGND